MKKVIFCIAVLMELCAPLKAQWESVNSGLMNVSYPISNADLVVHQDTIYAICSSALHKSTNIGASWEFISFPGAGTWGATLCIDLIADTLLYGTESRGVISNYYGSLRSWVTEQYIGGNFIGTVPFTTARVMAVKELEVLVNGDGALYLTTNFGATWTQTNAGSIALPGERLSSMMFVGDTLYASVYQSQIGSALVKSSNYGNTWMPIPNNIPNGNSQLAGLAKHGGHWFIGAEVGGIYTSTNGETFVNWSEGLPSGGDTTVKAYSFAIAGNYVLAATNWGIFRRPMSQLSVSQGGENQVRAFRLSQNYPNPFNPSTTIRYELPIASDVRLEVFDVLGKKVATLVSGRQSAGEQRAVFNANGLASGVYFYRLKTGSFIETKKMLLLK